MNPDIASRQERLKNGLTLAVTAVVGLALLIYLLIGTINSAIGPIKDAGSSLTPTTERPRK